MSLEAAAGEVAERLREQEFVEVFAHHDADGIAAASIVCHALHRAGVAFQLKIRPDAASVSVNPETPTLLCDLGSARADLPDDVMVIDHHVPRFEGSFHVNPRLAGIDGDRELSSAGAAYLVARHLGENRDLAGLALVGMIGDNQACEGMNREIAGEGMANGFIVPRRGLRLPGRDLSERLATAISPHLHGISGRDEVVERIVEGAASGGGEDCATLLSAVILTAMPGMAPSAARRLYGDTYELERELLHDAHTLAAIVDACGKSGRGGLAASLCLRDPAGIEEAWEITRTFRLSVVGAIGSARSLDEAGRVYAVDNPAVTGSVADALACDLVRTAPLAVLATAGEQCRISARWPAETDADLDRLMRSLAESCGGTGGGHRLRAGATIPANALDCFTKGFSEATAA